jgi:peptidoglycan/LPS O-acetylase OafA/YrhL
VSTSQSSDQRLHALDAVRGFALLLGVAYHATLSFMPGAPPGSWAINDTSPSQFLYDAAFATHIFRMALFFFIAGFFARLLHRRLGSRGFWNNRLKRILLPLIGAWVVVYPTLAFLWTIGLTKTFGGPPPPAPEAPRGIGAFPLTHLWFLYQLLLLYVVVFAARALVVRFDNTRKLCYFVDVMVEGSLRSLGATFMLGLPLATVLASLPDWYYWQGVPTPDQSLIPTVPASVGFGTAFAFGWLVHRSAGALPALISRCIPNLAIAIFATAWLLHMLHTNPPMAIPGLTKTLFALTYGVAIWSWVLGLTGAALRFLSNHSAKRRYIADASYWIYIMHLPLVIAFQVWVGHWPLHWSIKYALILVASLVVLFLSYHYLVRSTFIGATLNGRIYSRKSGGDPAPSQSPV